MINQKSDLHLKNVIWKTKIFLEKQRSTSIQLTFLKTAMINRNIFTKISKVHFGVDDLLDPRHLVNGGNGRSQKDRFDLADVQVIFEEDQAFSCSLCAVNGFVLSAIPQCSGNIFLRQPINTTSVNIHCQPERPFFERAQRLW